jgi:hypothetical protein
MEVRLKEVEYSMIENPDDLDLINTYTSLLEQFNNSG